MPQLVDSGRAKKVPQPVALLHSVPAPGTEAISKAVLGAALEPQLHINRENQDQPLNSKSINTSNNLFFF